MSKKNQPPAPDEPLPPGAERVLKEVSPRLDRIVKDLEGIKRHFHEAQPKAAKETAEKEVTISSGEGTGDADGHGALKANNPNWNYCPFCTDDDKAKLPELSADAPAKLKPGPDNRKVKCDTCGEAALEQWERCPGCGAKGDNFTVLD
jgi:hypothetical protein